MRAETYMRQWAVRRWRATYAVYTALFSYSLPHIFPVSYSCFWLVSLAPGLDRESDGFHGVPSFVWPNPASYFGVDDEEMTMYVRGSHMSDNHHRRQEIDDYWSELKGGDF